TGYFAVRLAEQLKNGQVICFEQAPKMAEYLENRLRESGFSNTKVRTDGSDGNLALEKQADLIFSVDVYHHIQDRGRFFAQLAQSLSAEGRIVIIDRTEEKVENQPAGHRVSTEMVKEEMKAAGLVFVEELNFLLPIQYYLSFKRAE
ncbi:MAG TPA: class I SAM-dependent methyltransferase, partial [Candidatus Paceibacterota bacterium]|nr:class I SAM-dependent methyltransferase [Candidatus Paceibacterota bacterium]